ncbi:unnamed protein product, partial [Urochloa humidicola]
SPSSPSPTSLLPCRRPSVRGPPHPPSRRHKRRGCTASRPLTFPSRLTLLPVVDPRPHASPPLLALRPPPLLSSRSLLPRRLPRAGRRSSTTSAQHGSIVAGWSSRKEFSPNLSICSARLISGSICVRVLLAPGSDLVFASSGEYSSDAWGQPPATTAEAPAAAAACSLQPLERWRCWSAPLF